MGESAAIMVNDSLKKELNPANEEGKILSSLERLGRLSPDFDIDVLFPLLEHKAASIRLLAIKNIGKLKPVALLEQLVQFARNEKATIVRREAISTIGRMRTEKAIDSLLDFLRDNDTKVVLQAIRALVPFRNNDEVNRALLQLRSHPNEIVRDVVGKELGRKQYGKDSSHPESPDFLKNVLVNGDVREILKEVPNESVHLTFTSPPYYNARDYTLYKSYEEYLEFLVSVFSEVHRITKEGRFFVLNTSPVIVSRMSRAHSSKRYLIPFDIHPMLTRAGWDFIEDIIWLKPDPSAKNRNGGFFQHRKPLGYKANSVSEYVVVYRKKTDKLIDWNMKQYPKEIIEASKIKGDYAKTNVWKIAPSSDKVHPATFPKDLASRVIQFYSFKGDLIFDPFSGVGTVGQAASLLERYFFLTEQERTYADRAATLLIKQGLFSEFPPKIYSVEEFQRKRQEGAK
jgi:DNA modification methylase